MRTPLAAVLCLTLAPAAALAQADEHAAMRSWINADRAAAGVGPLAADGRLDAVAESHARDMAAHRFFSHTSPTTGAPADRAAAAGVTFRLLAENIALNQSARAAHEALMRSPGHRANLLDGRLRRVGIGFARGADGLYVAQLFATLPGDAAVAPVAPPPDDADDPGAEGDDASDADDADDDGDTPAPFPPRPPVVLRVPARAPAATPGLPMRIDPRALAALLTEAQRQAEALARRHGRWTVPVPFELPRLPAPAPQWGDDGDEDDRDAPCARTP